jgi:hypothetical protein
MGQIQHRSATTTEAIRRALQHSQESLRTLSRRHGINPKTVAKWRKRSSTADHRTGPTVPQVQALSIEQEAVIVAFRSTLCCRSMTVVRLASRDSSVDSLLSAPLPGTAGRPIQRVRPQPTLRSGRWPRRGRACPRPFSLRPDRYGRSRSWHQSAAGGRGRQAREG